MGVDKAIHRLKKIGNITLSETDASTVKSLRNTRNAIEHFHWQTSHAETNVIVGQGLSFAIHFAKEELQTDIAYRFRDDDTWNQLLDQHRAFAWTHGERIERAMAAEGKTVQECSFCNAMAQDMTTGACSLCAAIGSRWKTQMRHCSEHPNNSLKPNLFRYTSNMAGKACHVADSWLHYAGRLNSGVRPKGGSLVIKEGHS